MKIEEAVAIQRRINSGHIYPEMVTQEGCAKNLEAIVTLADAYLALYREDDGELVTGFVKIGLHEIDVKECYGGRWRLWVDGPYRSSLTLDQMTQPTMGQLRHLIRGLGGEA